MIITIANRTCVFEKKERKKNARRKKKKKLSTRLYALPARGFELKTISIFVIDKWTDDGWRKKKKTTRQRTQEKKKFTRLLMKSTLAPFTAYWESNNNVR